MVSILLYWPQCPSTDMEVVVVVVVMVRCLSWVWSRMELCREASDTVLLSWKPLLLLIGVLTAEKERFFIGVAGWLRDKDSELDGCFLLRSVLERAEKADI